MYLLFNLSNDHALITRGLLVSGFVLQGRGDLIDQTIRVVTHELGRTSFRYLFCRRIARVKIVHQAVPGLAPASCC